MLAYANPQRFLRLARTLTPWTLGAGVLLAVVGVFMALFVAPPDYQQGDAFRIIYVHVPAAWMALFIYISMAASSAVAFI